MEKRRTCEHSHDFIDLEYITCGAYFDVDVGGRYSGTVCLQCHRTLVYATDPQEGEIEVSAAGAYVCKGQFKEECPEKAGLCSECAVEKREQTGGCVFQDGRRVGTRKKKVKTFIAI